MSVESLLGQPLKLRLSKYDKMSYMFNEVKEYVSNNIFIINNKIYYEKKEYVTCITVNNLLVLSDNRQNNCIFFITNDYKVQPIGEYKTGSYEHKTNKLLLEVRDIVKTYKSYTLKNDIDIVDTNKTGTIQISNIDSNVMFIGNRQTSFKGITVGWIIDDNNIYEVISIDNNLIYGYDGKKYCLYDINKHKILLKKNDRIDRRYNNKYYHRVKFNGL